MTSCNEPVKSTTCKKFVAFLAVYMAANLADNVKEAFEGFPLTGVTEQLGKESVSDKRSVGRASSKTNTVYISTAKRTLYI